MGSIKNYPIFVENCCAIFYCKGHSFQRFLPENRGKHDFSAPDLGARPFRAAAGRRFSSSTGPLHQKISDFRRKLLCHFLLQRAFVSTIVVRKSRKTRFFCAGPWREAFPGSRRASIFLVHGTTPSKVIRFLSKMFVPFSIAKGIRFNDFSPKIAENTIFLRRTLARGLSGQPPGVDFPRPRDHSIKNYPIFVENVCAIFYCKGHSFQRLFSENRGKHDFSAPRSGAEKSTPGGCPERPRAKVRRRKIVFSAIFGEKSLK